MQTIGKTTNKMDFPVTWTDILLKSISSKANYTIDVKIGAKRIAADSQDLRDIPKKRRKQSNPTRISSNEKTANSESGTKSSTPDVDNGNVGDAETDDEPKTTSSMSLPLNLTKPEIQNVPLDEARPVQFLNNVPQPKSGDAPPKSSPYQPGAKSSSHVERRDGYPTVSADGMLSFKNQPPGTSTANFGQSPVQIFNPEAFCELCNKEFCNKYFLKTHKANKHGVFTDGPANGFVADQADKNRSLPATCDFSSNAGDAVAAALSLFKSPAPYSQPPVHANAYASKTAINNQTRAFCSICNKEFCNKYFVKRHKAKIHGITDDGDYRAANDDAPFKLKTSLQIKSEIFDFAVSDAYKDENSVSPDPTAVDGVPSEELAKTPAEPFADSGESATGTAAAETQCSYGVKVEHPADDEENETIDCASKSSNEPPCDANGYYGNELSSGGSARGASYELALFQNEFARPDGEDVLRRLAEFAAAGDTGGAPIDPANGYEFGRAETDTVIVRNVETRDARVERAAREDAKSAGDAPPGASKCYTCNALVEGPLEAHVSDKHEGCVRELRLTSDSPEANGPRAERSCPECRRTFVSDASWRAHAEHGECAAAKGAGGSKSSAENDEPCARADRKNPAAALSSFCRICNKELCNKYFMKTHMQRMHGISIRNGNHIGGVVCDVCNKELCSKYFLRVHKQNSHGIVENGAACGPRHWPDGTSAAVTENGPLSDEPPDNGLHLHRYYKHYAEACTVCFRRFRSPRWLSAHLLNDHGDEGRAQWKHVQGHLQLQEAAAADEAAGPSANCGETGRELQQQQQMKQYRCSYCPFATSVLSFLFVHEKFHLTENDKSAAEDAFPPHTCSACCVTFPDRTRWEQHFAGCRAGKEFGGSSPDTGHNSTNASEDSSADANGNDAVAAEPGPPPPPPPANHEPFIMQSFFLENCSVSPSVKQSESCTGRSDSFHSSLVYLPVKEKLTSTVNVFFKLTPT